MYFVIMKFVSNYYDLALHPPPKQKNMNEYIHKLFLLNIHDKPNYFRFFSYKDEVSAVL